MDDLSIIIVDENNMFRQVLISLLISIYKVKIIANVSSIEELELIQNYNKADLILLDLTMPEINGIEFMKKIIKIHNDIQVIAITHYNDSVYRLKIIEAGFADCIFKDNLFNEINPKIKNRINAKQISNIIKPC
jgi:DNA-binding NarL/FixJ family response regulator